MPAILVPTWMGLKLQALNRLMTDIHDNLTEFLKRRLADLPDRDNSPEWEILDALIGWTEHGCPPPTISITNDPRPARCYGAIVTRSSKRLINR